MKVLYITNLFPLKTNPTAGIFVIRRIEKLNSLNIKCDFIPTVIFNDSGLVKFLKRQILKRQSTPNDLFLNTSTLNSSAKTIVLQRGLFDLTLNKIYPKRLTRIFVNKILKNVDISKYTLIHAHGMYKPLPAGEIALFLSKEAGIPYILTLHGSDINIVMPKHRKRYIKILENANKTIFVSNALLKKAILLGYSGKNAVVIPNGYDEKIFYPRKKSDVRLELGFGNNDGPIVGYVGNLVHVKRADKLPEIFQKIADYIPNVRFIIVGDGKLKKEIEKRTRNLNVKFVGFLTQELVAKYMNAMDVMILPSRNEGFGCVVLEAQACGTCVVGSSNGGIPEAIGFKEYVVEEGKDFEKRFAERVVEVLKKGYNPSTLINRAKEYTWSEVVRKEVDIYSSVLAESRKSSR